MALLRRSVALALLSSLLPVAGHSSAHADLRVCNKTTSQVGVAIGYKSERTWTSEGWWTVDADSCAILLAGPLKSRYYYMYAVDYEEGGEWSGRSAFFCTREKEFTIEGADNCVANGYQRTGFYEVDTGNQANWTIQLTEPMSQGVGGQ